MATVRIDDETREALDRARDAMRTRIPGARISRDAVAREVLRRGLTDRRILREIGAPSPRIGAR